MKKPRIISLWPATTEMLVALGLAQELVGRSYACNYRNPFSGIPVCFLPPDAPADHPPAIPRTSPAQAPASPWQFDSHLVRSLEPTHIIYQNQCTQCEPFLADWPSGSAEIESMVTPIRLEAGLLSSISESFFKLGLTFNRIFQAENIVNRIRTAWHLIEARAHEQSHQPTVVCLSSLSPLTVPGHWLPQLIRSAGAQAMCISNREHKRVISAEELLAVNPEYLLFLPLGAPLPTSPDLAKLLQENLPWRNMKAVFKGRVFRINTQIPFQYAGPEIGLALEILAEIFHGRAFDFGHRKSLVERVIAL